MTSTTLSNREDLENRIDTAGWGLFFVMSGLMLLLPGLPDGTWIAGVGALFLALSLVRAILSLPVSGFGLAVGAVLVVWGGATMANISAPWFALLLVVCGLALVSGELTRHIRQ